MPRLNSQNWSAGDQATAARLQDFNEDIDDIYSNGDDRLRVREAASGTALRIDISAGSARVGTTNVLYAGGTDLVVTNAATNYVEIDSSGTIQINTTGWTDTYTRLGKVTCAGGVITAIEQWRSDATGGDFGNVPTGTISIWPTRIAPANNLLCYGQAVSRSTYAALFAVLVPTIGNPTISIASPAVVSLTAHGLGIGDSIYFTTTGALPTGLSANTLYYIISAGFGANSFQISATRGGSAINTSGSQSGTHTLKYCPHGLGDGSTTFNVPDLRGRFALGNDSMGGSSANRATDAEADSPGAAEGAETVSIAHTHQSNAAHRSEGAGGGSIGYDYTEGSGEYTTSGMSANSTPNIMPPYLTVSYIIKT